MGLFRLVSVSNRRQQNPKTQDGQAIPTPAGSRPQGSRPYRLPGPVYPGQGGVLGPADPIHHPQRQGTRQRGRHPDPPRVRERGQETQIKCPSKVIISKCSPRPYSNVYRKKYSLSLSKKKKKKNPTQKKKKKKKKKKKS